MELVGEGDQGLPFAMWYEEESAGSGESDPAERLWNELDRMDLPFEGEPHDLWWSEAK